MSDPMDEVEAFETMKNVAKLAKTFYDQCLEEKFTEAQALTLTRAWLHGSAGGKNE